MSGPDDTSGMPPEMVEAIRVQRGEPTEAQGRARRRAEAGAMAAARAEYEVSTSQIEAAGLRFGLGPAEALQQASQASRAAFGNVGARGFETLLAGERFGVDLGLGAGVMGHFGRGYGAADPGAKTDADAFARVLGTAVSVSLEGSQIGQYLQQMTGLMENAYQMGGTLSTLGIGETMAGLGATGIAPVQAARIATSFTGAMMQQGAAGPQGAAGWALMRAAGYQGGRGPGEYARTMFGLQNPMDQPETFGRFVDSLRVPGLDPDTQAFVMQRAFQQIGVNMGEEQVRALASYRPGMASGMGAEDLISRGRLAMTAFGSITGEAQLEAERVGIGREIAPSMQAMLSAVNNIALAFNDTLLPIVNRLSKGLERYSERIAEAVGDKGLGTP